MIDSKLRHLSLRFESHSALSETETSELKRGLENCPQLLGEILDRQAVEGMLQLIATVAAEDEFVSRCVTRLSGQSNLLSTNSVVDEHDCSEPDLALANVAQLAKQRRSSRNRGRTRNAIDKWLVVAASIVVLMGAWMGYSWLINKDANRDVAIQANFPTMIQQPTTESNPPPITSDLFSEHLNTDVARVGSNAEPVEIETARVAPENHGDQVVDGSNSPTGDEIEIVDNRRPEAEINRNQGSKIAQTTDRPTIGVIEKSREAVWDGENPSSELGTGKFHLLSGSLALRLENGVRIRMFGPSEFQLDTTDWMRLESGNFVADIPRRADQFVITTPFGTLRNPANACVQLIVDPVQGVEALLTRGRICLSHANGEEVQDRIELAKNGLFQTIVRPILHRPTISPLIMARGQNKFEGQIGRGKDTLKLDSPIIFAKVLNRVTEPPQPREKDGEFSRNWFQFAQEFQAMGGKVDSPEFQKLMNDFLGENKLADPAKKIGDVLGNGTTNFQGSLSINGVEQKFNSREEYERARQQMLNGFPQGLLIDSQQNNSASDFKGVVSVNGRTLEFSSPDKFKALRKQMIR